MSDSIINRYTVYVTTCNSHIHLIRPFQFLFNTFWSSKQKVVVIGYKSPDFKLEPNFTFISLGEQKGGSKQWAHDVRTFFESLDDKYVIYMLEDMFLQRKVDLYLMDKVLKQTVTDPKLGRVGFTSGISKRKHTIVKTYSNYDLITLDQDAKYRIAVQTSLWNKAFLIRYMHDGYSPWDFEIKGSKASINDGYNIYSTTRQFIVAQIQSIVRGDFQKPRLTGIEPTVKEEIKKRRLL